MQSEWGWSGQDWKLTCNLLMMGWPQLVTGCLAHLAGSVCLTLHPCTLMVHVHSRTHPPGERGWWAGEECDLFVIVFLLVSKELISFFGQVCHVFAVLQSAEQR